MVAAEPEQDDTLAALRDEAGPWCVNARPAWPRPAVSRRAPLRRPCGASFRRCSAPWSPCATATGPRGPAHRGRRRDHHERQRPGAPRRRGRRRVGEGALRRRCAEPLSDRAARRRGTRRVGAADLHDCDQASRTLTGTAIWVAAADPGGQTWLGTRISLDERALRTDQRSRPVRPCARRPATRTSNSPRRPGDGGVGEVEFPSRPCASVTAGWSAA